MANGSCVEKNDDTVMIQAFQDMFAYIIVLVLASIVHEAGHMATMLWYKTKPKITFKWYGMTVASDSIFFVTFRQLNMINLVAILAGLWVVLFVNLYVYIIPYDVMLLYMLTCTIDLYWLINGFTTKDKDAPMITILKRDTDKIYEKWEQHKQSGTRSN